MLPSAMPFWGWRYFVSFASLTQSLDGCQFNQPRQVPVAQDHLQNSLTGNCATMRRPTSAITRQQADQLDRFVDNSPSILGRNRKIECELQGARQKPGPHEIAAKIYLQ
jgi:hypothetical protein